MFVAGGRRLLLNLVAMAALLCLPAATAGQASKATKTLPLPDDRYKADVMVVVAHPDDEGAATGYLARLLDDGKHVAVVFTTHGNSGGNEAGAEQAVALGDIREIEARRALAFLGVTNVWFLDCKDTASQNVLESLGNWGHGAALERLVRLVRLTRPEVILTFLPGVFIGEDHGDHQAAGVLGTEAFDLAGDPATFPSQVAASQGRQEPYQDNLRAWQPKKIYYFPDADGSDMFRGKGPTYSVKDVSKLLKMPYWRVSFESFRAHQTQAQGFIDELKGMNDEQVEKMATADGWTDAQQLVLGKSLVGGSVTGEVFENVETEETIPFSPPERTAESRRTGVSVELAGPWSFYGEFRRAHGLTHLAHPEPPEIAVQAGGTLVVPLWLRNDTADAGEILLTPDLPADWLVQSGAGTFALAPRQVAAGRVEIKLPSLVSGGQKKPEPQDVTIRAESKGKSAGVVKLRVALRKRALPQ
jgi:LmbE family N-acetylglucosaminyl deacetylase